MKSLFTFVLSLFSLVSCTAQTQLIPTVKNKLWGAITNNNKTLISFQYKSVDFYNTNYLLTITDKNKKGLYTIEGDLILKPKFDAIIPLDKTYFQVFQDGKTGVVKKGNQVVIPIAYDEIAFDTIQQNFILSKNANYGIINSDGKEIVPFVYTNIALYNGKQYLFKKNKQFALTDTLHNVQALHYFDELVGLENTIIVQKNSLWGLENFRGKTLLPTIYEHIKQFGKHHFLVKKEKTYSFFNQNGQQLTAFGYNEPFHKINDSLCWAKKNDTWISVNLNNAKEKNLNYETILDIQKGFFRVIQNNNLILVDKNSNPLFSTENYQDIEPINDSIFKVLKNRKWGVVNTTNDTVIPAQFDNISFIKTFQDSISNQKSQLFLVQNNFKMGVLNFIGDTLIPVIYDAITINQKDSVFITELNHQKGAIGVNGIKILEPIYDQVFWSEFQQAVIYKNSGQTHLKINTTNPITLEEEISFNSWSNKKGLFFAQKNKKNGMLNISNNIVIPFKYTRLYDLDKNYSIGITNAGATVFDKNGKRVLSDFYDSISIFYDGENPFFLVQKKNNMGLIGKQGTTIIPLGNYKLSKNKTSLIKAEKNGKTLGYFDLSGKNYF